MASLDQPAASGPPSVVLGRVRRAGGAALVACVLLVAARGAAKEILPRQLEGVGVEEHLGKSVDLSLPFVDHNGKQVKLGQYFDGKRPVILTLNYYRCTMLCTLELNALVDALRAIDWKPGKDFRIVTVSIDPKEGPKLAAAKRRHYLEALGAERDTDWTFLTGGEASIQALARSIGFKYKYLPKEKQFAHPAVIFMLSPKGKLTRYLYGIQYPANNVKFALIDASNGTIGTTVDRVLLSCFHYDPTVGAYGPFAMGIMRLAGAVVALIVAVVLAVFWRRERKRRRAQSIEVHTAKEALT